MIKMKAYKLTINRVFEDPDMLVDYIEDRAKNSPSLDCDSNAFTLIVRIKPHKRGYKLVSMFYLDNSQVDMALFADDTLYTISSVELYDFTLNKGGK